MSKIKIIYDFPKNALLTQAFLNANGISNQLTNKYIKAEYLKRVVRGLYNKFSDNVTWEGAAFSLQNFYNVIVSGKTSLELQDGVHYIPQTDKSEIFLSYDFNKVSLPKWVDDLSEHNIFFQSQNTTSLFKKNVGDVKLFETPYFSIKTSERERAVFEMLKECPQKVTFDTAFHICETLITLNPVKLRTYLKQLKSVKTIRLFYYIFSTLSMPFLKDIDFNFDRFIKGVLVIEKNGHFDKKHKIFVSRV